MHKKYEITLGWKPMIFETGLMAKQADGAVTVRYGDTMVLVAVCASRKAKEGTDFFPLTCDYQEKSYAGGKIPGGYFKREGKATEKEVLSGRLMDRPIRPLFPEGFYYEVQVTATVLASDKEHNADILAMNAASAALMISGIPYLGPMAAARVGDVDGQFILNPTYLDLEESPLDIIVATTELGIIMIEAGAKIVSEERVIQALEFATEALKPVLKLQRDMQKHSGKTQWTPVLQTLPVAFMDKVRKQALSGIDAINSKERSKEGRENALSELAKKIEAEFVVEGGEITADMCDQAFHDRSEESVREFILSQKMRTDGRKYDEIRAITCEIGVLPRTHGSALFTRGQTQSLGVATLGTSRAEQIIDRKS